MNITIAQICLKNVGKTFENGEQNLVVFSNVTAQFQRGISYALTGQSGIGKSTLLHIAAGLDEPTQGQVYFDELPISTLHNKKKEGYLHDSLGFVFQQPYLIGELSVLENVVLKGFIAGRSPGDIHQEALYLLEQYGLYEKRHEKPRALSGGQQQRVALARAFMNRPSFLFADEPTGNLDNSTSDKIIDIVIEYQKKFCMGIVMSTHNMALADRFDIRYHIENGNLVQQ